MALCRIHVEIVLHLNRQALSESRRGRGLIRAGDLRLLAEVDRRLKAVAIFHFEERSGRISRINRHDLPFDEQGRQGFRALLSAGHGNAGRQRDHANGNPTCHEMVHARSPPYLVVISPGSIIGWLGLSTPPPSRQVSKKLRIPFNITPRSTHSTNPLGTRTAGFSQVAISTRVWSGAAPRSRHTPRKSPMTSWTRRNRTASGGSCSTTKTRRSSFHSPWISMAIT